MPSLDRIPAGYAGTRAGATERRYIDRNRGDRRGREGGQLESVALILGKRLRRLREKAGLTQTDLAKAVLSNKTAMSEIELGHQVPKLDLVERLEAALDADGVLMDLYVLLSLGVQESAVVADAEQGAISITDYEHRNIPGLLQAEDYMRANMLAGRIITPDRVESEMAIRVARQAILSKLITGWFILGEEVLHRPCGGKDAMHAQLAKLEEIAEMRNMYIQVLPFSVTDAPGYDGPLRVVEYAGKGSIWFTEGPRSGRTSDDREEVMQVLASLNVIRAAALSVSESVQFIRDIREQRYEQ